MLNPADIRRLADYPAAREGPVLNLFCHLAPEDGFRDHDAVRRKDRLHELEKKINGNHPLSGALAEARRRLADLPAGPRGAAMFLNSRGLIAEFRWAVPPQDAVEVGRRPFVRRLLELAEAHPTVAVAAVDGRSARIMMSGVDGMELIREMAVDLPRKTMPVGSTNEDREQDHRREISRRLADDLAAELERLDRERGPHALFLLGQDGNVNRLMELLPERVARKCIPHAAPGRFEGPVSEYQRLVRPLIDKHMAEEKAAAARRLRGMLQQGWHAVEDEQPVWDQMLAGNVVELFFGSQETLPCSACPRCDMVFTDRKHDCPYCGAGCQESEFDEELAAWAVRHNVPTRFLPMPEPGEPRVSVAAILRHDADARRPVEVPAGQTAGEAR
jgi:hypothetical protein